MKRATRVSRSKGVRAAKGRTRGEVRRAISCARPIGRGLQRLQGARALVFVLAAALVRAG